MCVIAVASQDNEKLVLATMENVLQQLEELDLENVTIGRGSTSDVETR